MIRTFPFFALVATLALPALASPSGFATPLVADVADGATALPMDITTNGHARITATANGKPVTFILDTGAGMSLLGTAAAERCGVTAGSDIASVTGGGKLKARIAVIDTLAVGGYVSKGMRVVLLTLPAALEGDGILGRSFFDAAVVTIDYATKTVVLTDPTRFTPPKNALVLPIEFDGSNQTIAAVIDNAKVRFQIDTGAASAVTLYPPFVQRQDLLRKYKPSLPETSRAVGGELRGVTARIPAVTLGSADSGVTLTRMEGSLLLPQADSAFTSKKSVGSLGAPFWAHFVVAIDYKHKKLYAIPNADFSQPFPMSRGGMACTVGADGGTVTDVLPNSATTDARLVPGDVIKQVNGIVLDDATRSQIRALLRQPAGTTVKLLVVPGGGGRSRYIVLTLRDVL